jgi:hypothetical protein
MASSAYASALDWPEGFERTKPAFRTKARKFQSTLGQTTEELATEMDRLDPDEWRASIGNQHTKSNGLPRHDANPDDPGFVLRWTKDGQDYAVACDKHSRLKDNVRVVYLWVHETRMRGQRPVVTGSSEFAAARLPSGEEDDTVVATAPPHEVLDVAPDAAESVIKAAAQARIKEAHPDQGGTTEELQRVRRAREAMLDE